MNPSLVADVGNSRIKWGRCQPGRVVESVSLPPDDPGAWHQQLDAWGLAGSRRAVVSGVHPRRRDLLVEWLRDQVVAVNVLDSSRQLPLVVHVEVPDHVGIDRLLKAVAANGRRQPEVPAVLVDAGTAVTVDWLDVAGAYCGGSIFPGLRLMARALSDHTALLPLVDVRDADLALPATSTPAAIAAGVYWAAVGGIRALVSRLTPAGVTPQVYLTGGDSGLLAPALPAEFVLWPDMTLEGMRRSAESWP
jgi:type III pantothenate kinase